MPSHVEQRPRGFILLIVLTLMTALLLIGTLLYQQSHDSVMTAAALKNRAIAAARAEQGAQAALVDIKNNFLNVQNLAPCASLATCLPAQLYTVTLDLGAGGDPALGTQNAAGGGLQYSYTAYRRSNPSGATSTVVVTSTGFVGYSTDPNNQLSSVVEVEVSAPIGSVALQPPGGVGQTNYSGGGN